MVKIVLFVIICSILIIYLKTINNEFAFIVALGAGIIVLCYSLDYVLYALDFFNKIVELTNIDKELYMIIFKITAIGYLIEFSADIVNDFGLKSLSDKLVFVGKLIIFSISLPIFYAVINLISNILQ